MAVEHAVDVTVIEANVQNEQEAQELIINNSITMNEVFETVSSRPEITDHRYEGSMTRIHFNGDDFGARFGEVHLPIGTFPLTRHAFDQICSRINFDMGPTSIDAAKADEVQFVMDKLWRENANPDTPYLWRITEGVCFAHLGKNYRPFDNKPLISKVIAATSRLKEDSGFENPIVTRFSDRDHDLKLRVNYPSTAFLDPDGRTLWGGFDVYNSERGNGSLSIIPSIFRLICTNGMVSVEMVEDRYRRYHVSDAANMHELIYKAIAEGLPQTVETFKYHAQKAYETPFDPFIFKADKISAFKPYTRINAISNDDALGILNNLKTRPEIEGVSGNNTYALSQAVSHYAQTVTDFRKRAKFEKAAVEILMES